MVEKKYLVGSKLLAISNTHDTDFVCIVDKFDKDEYNIAKENNEHIIFYEKELLVSILDFALPFNRQTVYKYLYSYQLDKDIIGQDFPYEHSVLKKRDRYIELLKWVVETGSCNFAHHERLNGGNCSKIIYHIAYIVFILQNNSVEITSEQKAIVQKIHDKQMSQSYLDELARIIYEL